MAMLRLEGCTPFMTAPLMRISPAGDLLKAGDHVQKRGLAAARGPDEDEELPLLDEMSTGAAPRPRRRTW